MTIHKFTAAVFILFLFAPSAPQADDEHMLTCFAERSAVDVGEVVDATAFPGWDDASVTWHACDGSIISENGDTVRWQSGSAGRFQLEAKARTANGMKSCLIEIVVAEPDLAPSDDTGYLFLETDRDEARGYAVYSYVVFWDPITDRNREMYKLFLDDFLATVPEIAALEGRYLARDLNITYVPVTETAPAKPDAEWILEHYDLTRARYILSRLDNKHRAGPSIVSFLGRPAGEDQLDEVVVQTFAGVRDHLRASLIKAYVLQMTQEHDWGDTTARQIGLRLRNTAAHFARGIKDARDEVANWINWLRLAD